MRSRFFDGKNVSLIASIASFVCAGVSLIGALLCLIGKKKTTATIFAALSCIAAAVGAVTAYTLRLAEESSDVFDGFDPYDYDEDDSDDEDEDDEPYMIPISRQGKQKKNFVFDPYRGDVEDERTGLTRYPLYHKTDCRNAFLQSVFTLL